MIENGYYKVDSAYFNFFSNKYGCMFKFNKDGNRPVFCCNEDAKLKGLYWAVPTGRADNKDLSRINKYISLPKDKLGCNFYHVGYSNRPAIFYISSAFPITDKYIDGEYTSQGIHLITKDERQNRAIRIKLRNIIAFENFHVNYFEQRITDIKNTLIAELSDVSQ